MGGDINFLHGWDGDVLVTEFEDGVEDDFGFFTDDETLVVVDQADVEWVFLRIYIDIEDLCIGVSDSKYFNSLRGFAERNEILPISKNRATPINPNLDIINSRTFLIIKPHQLPTDMSFLTTHNRPFPNHRSRRKAIPHQLHNIKPTFFWDLIYQNLLINNLKRVFTILYLEQLLIGRVEIL